MEGDAGCSEQPIQQTSEGAALDIGQLAAFYQAAQPCYQGIGLEDGFTVKLPEDAFLGLLRGGCGSLRLGMRPIEGRYFAQHAVQPTAEGEIPRLGGEEQFQYGIPFQFRGQGIETVVACQLSFQCLGVLRETTGIGVSQYGLHGGIVVASRIGMIAVHLHLCQCGYIAAYRCLRQREAHGDVHVVHIFRYRIQDGQQQRFVAEHHGRLLLTHRRTVRGAVGLVCLA